jgi:hypothetical protein
MSHRYTAGSGTSIEAMTEHLGITKGRRQPIELTPTRLFRLNKDLPHEWSEQRHFLGFAEGRSMSSGRKTNVPLAQRRSKENCIGRGSWHLKMFIH